MQMRALLNSTALTGFASGVPITPEIVSQTREGRAHGGGAAEWTDPMLRRSADSKHMLPFWDKVDDVLDGIDGMRAKGEEYLPKFVDEDNRDYQFRLKCTKMTNVYRDIVEGLSGKPFEQPVMLTKSEEMSNPPDTIKQFVEDVDGSGNNITVFAGATFFNGINNALDWILVDFDKPAPGTPRPVNRADEIKLGLRPYWSHILARNVIDVQSKVIATREVITYFKVFEPGKPDHIREFIRNDDGSVVWNLFEKQEQPVGEGDDRTHFLKIDSGRVSIGRIPVVPFVTGRREGRTWRVSPQLKDALDLQVELYQGESDLKFAKKLTAFPMLAANGIQAEKDASGNPKRLAVGPSRVLYSKPDGATGRVGTWSYVEPSAESLKFLASENEAMIRELRELGKQPLTAQSGNITVITAMVAAGKAKSTVKGWAVILKDALENALVLTAAWLGITDYDPEVYVHINFDDYSEGEDLDALLRMRERSADKQPDISQETLWDEMKRRGVLSSNFSSDTEERRLLDELPGDGPDTVQSDAQTME